MPRNLKLRYLIPALVALAMIVCGVVVSAVNTRNNLRDSKRVTQSRRLLQRLENTLRLVLDLETGERGFILIGEPEYLEPYDSALERMDNELEQLVRFASDKPQRDRAGEMSEIVKSLEIDFRQIIEIRREQGMDAAVSLVRAGQGKAGMNRLRRLAGEMRAEETVLLEKRASKLDASLRRTDLTIFASGVIAIGAGVLGATMLLLFLSSKDREGELRFQKEKAEDADRAKSEFLAMMSHEIRTPMNAILGFGELLHDLSETPRQKHFAAAILSSGHALLSLINDILDLSKIEAGKIDIVPELVRISSFASSIETLFSFHAAEKGLNFTVKVTPEVPVLLHFDALRLRQILVNLVGNAIKFCSEGSVTIIIDAAPTPGAGEDNLELRVDVADTGIGISQDDQAGIFRPFYQVDSRQSRNFQGTGLGLTISRRLVGVMGGGLTVSSEPGQGSLFQVSIPTRICHGLETVADETPQSVPIDFDRLRPSTILLVDEDPLNRELIRSHLHGSAHRILEAETGGQAVALSLGRRPDIVLIDIRMPSMNGLRVRETLLSQEATRQIPAIAVLPPSSPGGRADLDAVFDGFAEKPLDRRKLFAALAKFLAAAESGGAAPASAASAPLSESVPPTAAELAELLEELETLRQTVWPDLAKLVPAQGTLNFSSQLARLASEYRCDALARYAVELSHLAGTMEFTAAGKMLRAFPTLIEQLQTDHD